MLRGEKKIPNRILRVMGYERVDAVRKISKARDTGAPPT
jgi:hypothetical protein